MLLIALLLATTAAATATAASAARRRQANEIRVGSAESHETAKKRLWTGYRGHGNGESQ